MLSWQDKLQSLAERIGEPELFTGASYNTEQLTPYFDPDVVETWLYRASLFYLRQVPLEEIEAIGSYAIAVSGTTIGSGITITTWPVPQNVLRVLYLEMTLNGQYIPAEYVSPAVYTQMLSVAQSELAIYSIIGGHIAIKGPTSFRLVYLTEVPLSFFQSDIPILPPGYDEDSINRAKSLMMLSDFLPQGRL